MRSTFTVILAHALVCAQGAFLSAPTFSSPSFEKARTDILVTKAVSDMVNLDDSNRHIVLGDDKTVLIDAYAPWCGPCKLIEPVIERCAAKWEGKVDFVRYDVESGNNRDCKMDMLSQQTMITKLPTLVLYQESKIIASHSGLISYDELEEFIATALHDEVHEDDGDSAKRGKVSFGSSLERDDYALGM